MAVIKSATDRERLRRWVKFSQEKAQCLLSRAEALSSSVFSSPETLAGFLDLTARLHHYDACNLLLIWDAYPAASCLAGYKVWERQVPSGAQVLKQEFKGKAIDLIAPFTDSSNGCNCLVWYSVSVFDVTQTTIPSFAPPFDTSYVLDDDHEYFLMDAINQVLSIRFGRSVIVQPASQLMAEVGLPGQITKTSVTVRMDLSPEKQLQWLTEVLSLLSIEGSGLAPSSLELMKDCIEYCLFRIWGLDGFLHPPSSIQIRSVTSGHLTFLHLFRDTVRDLNNQICSCYLAKRRESEDAMEDLQPEDFIGL